MGPLFLRLIFYMITGALLALISWSTISHSAVTGDYALSLLLMVMMFCIVGQFFVDRLRPEVAPKDFHSTRLWKMPHTYRWHEYAPHGCQRATHHSEQIGVCGVEPGGPKSELAVVGERRRGRERGLLV